MEILGRIKYVVFLIVIVSLIGESFAQIPYKHPYPEVPFRPPLKIEPYLIHRHNRPPKIPGFEDSNGNEMFTTETSPEDETLYTIKEMAYNACSTNYPITEEMRINAKKGILSLDRTFKCYLNCSYDTFGLIDDNNQMYGDGLLRLFLDHLDGLIEDIVKFCTPNENDKLKITSTKPDACEEAYKYVKCSLKINSDAVKLIPVI